MMRVRIRLLTIKKYAIVAILEKFAMNRVNMTFLTFGPYMILPLNRKECYPS